MPQWLRRLLYPSWLVIILLTLMCTTPLVHSLMQDHIGWVDGVLYAFATYTLTLWVLALIPVVSRVYRAVRTHRWTQPAARRRWSLWSALTFSLGFALFKLISGVYTVSYWLITLGVYTLCMTGLRVFLLTAVSRNAPHPQRTIRISGIVLLLTSIVLAGETVLVLKNGHGFTYPGYFIFVAAAYAFYAIAMAIRDTVRHRRAPLPFAAALVANARALVTLFALQTAMFASFGTGDAAMEFTMNVLTASVVWVVVFGLAIWLITMHPKQKRN